MNPRNLIIAIFLFSSVLAYSQRAKVEKAKRTYYAGEYVLAIESLKEAYEFIEAKPEKAEVIFMIANCYRKINDQSHAELWFKKCIEKDYQDPLVFLYYADALRCNEKYSDAEVQYKKYKDLVPDDPRGQNGIASCNLARKWLDNPNGYIVENMKFFNSKESDYCPTYGKNDYMVVYFTSSRKVDTKAATMGATGQVPSDIFVSRQDRKDKWSTPEPLGEEVNSPMEEGAPSVNATFTTLYYASCKQQKNKKNGCQIFSASISGDAVSKGEPIDLLADSLVAADPAISPDNLCLYFVSDMPGGVGGNDIWKVTRTSESDKWGAPENAGSEINTTGDERFPYVHPDGTLYFSSNGHIGLGGLDIFKARKQTDGKYKIENMRYPINSPSDDFGITFMATEERGFFSSSRNKGDDDIFSFVLPPLKFNIAGLVFDEKTNDPIEGAKVRCIGSDGAQMDATSGKDGGYKFMLKAGTDYVIIASREGYLNSKLRETTKGLDKSKDFKSDLSLASIAKPIELPNIFYDFGKWDLRPESMVALEKLVETLNDNANITIELGSHTDCRGSDAANNELSQKRAQSVVDFLISKGIAADRLTAKGYGESKPKEADTKVNQQYPFIPVNTKLTEEFINTLTPDQQAFADQLNRRTEFRVLRTDYVPKK